MKAKRKDLEALAQRIAHGDYEAEEELFKIYHSRIRLIVTYRVFNPNLVEDMVAFCMELVLKTLRAGKYNPTKGPLPGYIYGICKNEVNRVLRKEAKHSLHLEYDDTLSQDYRPQPFDDPYDMEVLQEAVRSLSPRLQQVLILRYTQEFSIEEIMDEMELATAQKVYDLLSEAKKQIRRMVQLDSIL